MGAENDDGLKIETAAHTGNLALEKSERSCLSASSPPRQSN